MIAPDVYRSNNPMQLRDCQKIIEDYKDSFEWEKDEKVLDVGCGPGSVTISVLKPILPEGAVLVGGDVSDKMVEYANQKYGGEKTFFQRLDIQAENIWDSWRAESFTRIFSFYCLHWVQNQKRAAENMFKLLKPGGTILLAFLGRNPVFELYEKLAFQTKWSSYMQDVQEYISPYYKSIKPELDLSKALTQADFEDISSTSKSCQFTFPSMSILLKAVEAVNPFLRRIPLQMRESYMKDIENMVYTLQSTTVKHSGAIQVDYQLLIATAVKRKSN